MVIVSWMVQSAWAWGCEDGRVTVDGVEATDLGAALATAPEWAWIEVCAGTYTGNFAASVPVILIAPDGAADTVLDGGAAGTVLTLDGDSVVLGFTVTNGAASGDGGGIRLSDAGLAYLESNVITGNVAVGRGGGLSAPDGATVLAYGNRISGNTAQNGGGIAIGAPAGAVPNQGSRIDLWATAITDNTAVGNAAQGSAGGGGGLDVYDTTVYDGEISGNRALDRASGPFVSTGLGGGACLRGASSLVWSVVTDNTAADGGGVALAVTGESRLEGVWIEGNTATGSTSPFDPTAQVGGNGGGVRAFPSATAGPLTVSAYGSVIRGNAANQHGGGVAMSGRSRFGGPSFGIAWSGGQIDDNATITGNGGGIWSTGGTNTLGDVVVRSRSRTRQRPAVSPTATGCAPRGLERWQATR